MADQMKLALRGALLSAAADGVTDGAVECVDAVVDTFRAEIERLRGANKLMNDCLEELCTCGESPYSHECLPCDAIIAAREALEATDD